LVEAYRQVVQKARRFVVEHELVSLPGDERLTVQTTPSNLWGVFPNSTYLQPAPFDKETAGRLWVTPVSPEATDEEMESQLRGHGFARMACLTLHEIYPGHHLQQAWAKTNVSTIRRLFASNLLAAGWAFYGAELMEQEGFLATPAEKLRQAADSLLQAARAVLDVSLHTREMTPQEAIDVLVGMGLDKPSARAEVQARTFSPTQGMTSLIGKQQIQKLVAKRRQQEGPAFNLARCHTKLLRCGAIPPALSARQMGVDITNNA
jgi:uncharacterized protein (DUF885 family)